MTLSPVFVRDHSAGISRLARMKRFTISVHDQWPGTQVPYCQWAGTQTRDGGA